VQNVWRRALTKGAYALPDKFPREGLVRLNKILAPRGPVPVSKSAWWKGVAEGRFPQPVKLGPRTTAWRATDIRRLYEQTEDES
jgi:predicted DNA-binding transcriptional regulator AlpA